MIIVTKIRLDRNQMPYWSARLMHNGDCKLECTSKTFNPRNKKEFREWYENTQARMMIEIQKEHDQDSVVRMLIQEDVPTNNKPIGS